MKSYRETLTAGVATALNIKGKALFITRCDAGPVLSVELIRRQAENGKIENIGKGLQVAPVGGFEGLKIKSTVNVTVDFVVTDGGFDLAFNEDATIVGNGDVQAIPIRTKTGERLPVDVGGATVNVALGGLTTLTHRAPVAVGIAATSLGAADATLKKLVFRNDHATAKVALGGAGVTLANGAIVLLPGDLWKEEDAAGAAWHAISDTAATNVQVMELK